MRKFVSTTLSLLLFSLAFDVPAAQVPASAQPQVSWETYTFSGEEFSVALPEMPALDHSTRYVNGRPDENGTARNYGAYNDGVVYLIRSYDKPRGGEDLDYFLKDFVGHLLNANRGIEIKAQREMTLGKFPGRQYVIVRNGKPVSAPESSIYVFLTSRHAYALRADGGDDQHPDVQRFLASFTLADKPAGRQIVDESKLPRPPVPLALTQPEKKTPPKSAPESKGSMPGAGGGAKGAEKAATGDTAARSGGSAADEQPYQASEVTRRALIVYKPTPHYTPEARHNQVSGVVRLRILLSATGKVTNIVAVKPLPDGLNEAAAFAASHIRFIPAVKDGQRVSQYVTIEYYFNIY